MTSIKPGTNYLSELQFSRRVFWTTLLAAMAGLLAFYMFPNLDMYLAGQFFSDGDFILRKNDTWALIRSGLMFAFTLYYIWVVVGLIASLVRKTDIGGFSSSKWLYLVACSLTGPLLLTNILLKSHITRDRPRSILEFGGSESFKPVYELTGSCADNCSFVSGEVSSMVMIFAAMMFVTSGRLRALFALLLLPAWALSGVVRSGMGAHFPSDIFFAGIFMILIAAVLYRLLVLNPERPRKAKT